MSTLYLEPLADEADERAEGNARLIWLAENAGCVQAENYLTTQVLEGQTRIVLRFMFETESQAKAFIAVIEAEPDMGINDRGEAQPQGDK